MSRSTEEQDGAGRLGRPTGPPKRKSARRKAEVVVRLLRGEDIGEVSREIRVAPAGAGAVAAGVPRVRKTALTAMPGVAGLVGRNPGP